MNIGRVIAAFLAVWLWRTADTGAEPVGHDDAFAAACGEAARAAQAAGTTVVRGQDGWLFLASELRHLSVGQFWGEYAAEVSRATRPAWADPLPAILDVKRQLDERGVRLLLVPVPPKAVVYAAALPGAPDTTSAGSTLKQFYALLRKNGVEVLNLEPDFQKARASEGDPLFCRQDSHWSGRGCVLASERIASVLRPMLTASNRSAATGKWDNVEIAGDLWKALEEPRPPRETVRLRRVGSIASKGDEPIAPQTDSPVLLLGDSHNLIFHDGGDMLARGAGLPDQLALELGMPVDLVAVRGSGATPARINLLRRAQKDPKYWAGKRVVVWCFTAREFTESDGWRTVPVAPPAPPAP